ACHGTCNLSGDVGECLYVDDKKCRCTSCGWKNPDMDSCFGICSNSICYQHDPNGDCRCNQDKCHIDYASDKCVGSCTHDGKHTCIKSKNSTCTCTECGFDIDHKQCMGPAGCVNGGCFSPFKYGQCQ
ncbi:hypothetical protein KIPB_013227, partial [Kipferlia bialata]